MGMSATGDVWLYPDQIPKHLTTDINEVTVTLKVPGKYFHEKLVRLQEVLQSMTNQRLQSWDDYQVTPLFNNYQKSEVPTLPENLKSVAQSTNYSLTLRVPFEHQWAGNSAQWYHLKPGYNDYRFTKYIN